MNGINRIDVVFLNFFLPELYRYNNTEKQAKIQFLCSLNCFLKFSVFLVSVLNDKKNYLECSFQLLRDILKINTDTKNTENLIMKIYFSKRILFLDGTEKIKKFRILFTASSCRNIKIISKRAK